MTYRHTTYFHGDYLDGDLSLEQRQEIDRHLASCAECREDLEKLRLLLGSMTHITVPDPGSEYFEALTEMVLARTGSMTAAATETPAIIDRRSPGRIFLTTTIKLAAAITLLFMAFYVSDFNQERQATRWAEHIRQSNYVVSDGAGTPEQLMPLSAGINTLLGQPSETEQKDTQNPPDDD